MPIREHGNWCITALGRNLEWSTAFPQKGLGVTDVGCDGPGRRLHSLEWMRRMRNIHAFVDGKSDATVARLLVQWWSAARDIADPWYTGDFDAMYRDDIGMQFRTIKKEL